MTVGGMVGRTRARNYYTKVAYSDMATIGVEFSSAKLSVDGILVKLQIWDISSQDRYKNMTSTFYRGACAITLWFSVERESDSYQSITKHFFPRMQEVAPGVPVILVGNKIDLRGEGYQCYTTEEGWKLAKQINAVTYLECSALTGEGVANVFEAAARVGLW